MGMRALVMTHLAAPLVVKNVAIPELEPDGVLVKVRATGLCRSDWHAWVGHDDVTLPHVPGHELAGDIVAVGDDVTHWQIGDRVTIPFVEGCGACEWCLAGESQVCPHQEQPGFTHWGSFAEYVALRHAQANLVRIPDGVSYEAAASLGCRFATAYRALVARARVQADEWVLIVGAGGVGLSACMIAHALGARVLVIDVSDDALALARTYGAEVALTAGEASEAHIHTITGGGAHVAMDAVGSELTAQTAILGLRRRGRHVQVGLLPPAWGHPRIPMSRVIGWELDVFGSHGMAAKDYPEMLRLVESGALAPEKLIARVVSLGEAAGLLPAMSKASTPGITMIDPAM